MPDNQKDHTSKYIERVTITAELSKKKIERERKIRRSDAFSREGNTDHIDSVEYWLSRGLCQDSAEKMAGVKESSFSCQFTSSREPLLFEERDKRLIDSLTDHSREETFLWWEKVYSKTEDEESDNENISPHRYAADAAKVKRARTGHAEGDGGSAE